MAVMSFGAWAQTKTVNGTVKDKDGEALVGATVSVKGTTKGAATDIDGKFTIAGVPDKGTLVISYVGYETQQVPVAGKTTFDIVLDENNSILDDVVVIGYGTAKRKDLTGAVASMKNSDVVVAPTNNVMEALQGKVAGMDITKGSGEVGSGVSINLRGTRSIYGSDEPLFIIDGLPGSYNQINPNDIESIDILKDASSTAIYGSAGANGVIIITTKRGKEGKSVVNFDAYWGFSGSPNVRHGMIGDEWTAYQREAYKYINGNYPVDAETLLGNPEYAAAYNAGKWIDWTDEVQGRHATTQKYALSVSGGTKNTHIFASSSFTNEKGLIENDDQKLYTLRLNIDQYINKFATIGFISNLTYTDRNRGTKNTFTKGINAFPLGDPYDENGKINHEYISNQYTILGDFIENQFANNTRSTYINAIGYLDITPFKGLKFRSQVNATLANSRLGQYWGKEAHSNVVFYGTTPYGQKTEDNSWGYTWENILNYNIDINDHSIGATAITSYTKDTSESTVAASGGFLVDSWQYHNLKSGENNMYVESTYTQTQKMSYAIRLNYSYKGRYLVNLSNRWDGVSWFSEGHKWDSFPAAAVAWRFSEEIFLENCRTWLDNAKLRVSYGVTGNSGGTGAYATQSGAYIFTNGGVTVDGKNQTFAQYNGTLASALLGWEKSYNWNIGLDFGFINGRLDGSIEWFRTDTKGLLFKRTMPITTGATYWGSPLSSWQNLAKTRNHGFELTINSRNIVNNDFQWSTNFTATYSKGKIISLPEGDIIDENLFVGQPVKSIYGYKYEGLWKTTDDAALMEKYNVKPGFVKVSTNEIVDDKGNSDNGIHPYGPDDRQILGHSNPDWILGLNNTFSYKGFDLSIFLMGRFGQTIMSDILGYYTASSSVTTNQLAGVEYWTENNQNAYYPRPGTADSQANVMPSLRVVSGSFAKIKNITLGYTFPAKWTRHALIERLRIYATAYNPVIIVNDSKLKGTDPEMGGSDGFPTYKQFVFGLNVTF